MKLLAALLFTATLAHADGWDEIADMHNKNVQSRSSAVYDAVRIYGQPQPQIIYIPPTNYQQPYQQPIIQGNPNLPGTNFGGAVAR